MLSAVRKGDFKLIEFYLDKRVELCNLKDNLGEKQNLAAKMPQKAAEIQKLLNDWKKEVQAEEPVIQEFDSYKRRPLKIDAL